MLQVLLMRAFLFVLLPTFSYSWGTTGHEIVANVAWDSLSKRTQAWVEDILNTTGSTNTTEEDQSPLGAVADWADRVRHFLPWSGPLHYIDVRDDLLSHGCHVAPHLNPTCQFLYERDCANNTCVAGAIVNYTQQLLKRQQRQRQPKLQLAVRGTSTGSNEIPQTKEALMFLTQYVMIGVGKCRIHVCFSPLVVSLEIFINHCTVQESPTRVEMISMSISTC